MTDEHAQLILKWLITIPDAKKSEPRTKRQRGFNEGLDEALKIVKRYIHDFETLEKEQSPTYQ